jgi:hypothetical protein
MKPDMIIGNPPYGGLDKKIMKKCVELFSETEMVFLAPVRWLQEDYDGTKSTDVFKDKKVELVDSGPHLWDNFKGAHGALDLGIYNINGKINDYKKISKKPMSYFGTDKNLTIKKYSDSLKSFVPISSILVYHGIKKDKPNLSMLWKQYGWVDKNKKCRDSKFEGQTLRAAKELSRTTGTLDNWNCVMFKTDVEVKNFWDYIHLDSFRGCMYYSHVDVHVHLDRLPFPNDFEEPWTDERFYAYFNISLQERKLIESTVKEWQ